MRAHLIPLAAILALALIALSVYGVRSTSAQETGTVWTLVETQINSGNDPLAPNADALSTGRRAGSVYRWTVAETRITHTNHYVDNGFDYYDVTWAADFDKPPDTLVEGEKVELTAILSGEGRVTQKDGSGIAFEYRADDVRNNQLDGKTYITIGMDPIVRKTTTGSFVVPGGSGEFKIYAFLWNCPPCDVTWTYRSQAGQPPPTQEAPSTTSCDFDGIWDTSFGRMTLTQTGTSVTGTYTHDSGRITGTVRGNLLVGKWSEAPSYSEPNDAGDIEFELSADCKSFSGKWKYGSTGSWGGWDGTFVKEREGSPTPTPRPTPTAIPPTATPAPTAIPPTATPPPISGEQPVRLTSSREHEFAPAWETLPGSNTIAYLKTKSPPPANVPNDIYSIQADGTGQAVLATGPASDFGVGHSLSWAGRTGLLMTNERVTFHEYMTLDPARTPFTRTVTDGNDRIFTRTLLIPGGQGGDGVAVSRDGSTVLWRHSTQGGCGVTTIRVAPYSSLNAQDANAHGNVLLTTDTGSSCTQQAYQRGFALTPDGSQFVISVASGTGSDLFLYSTGGSGLVRQLTTSGQTSGASNVSPDISPDGRRAAFGRSVPGSGPDLYAVNLDGSGLSPLTTTNDFSETDPSWSTDGSRLAFQGAAAGTSWDIYVMDVGDTSGIPVPPVPPGSGGVCAPVPAGLGWWPGESNANDLWGKNDGTLQNGAAYADGLAGQAFSFDGVDDFVSTDLRIDQSSGSPGLTMEAWVRPTSASAGRHHVISSDNNGFDWSLLRESATWYVFTGEASRTTGFSVDLNQWQHVAAVFVPGTGVRFYKNGQEVAISQIAFDTSDNTIAIGRNPRFGEFFAGQIDEASIINRPLSAREIRAIYEAGSAGKCGEGAGRVPPIPPVPPGPSASGLVLLAESRTVPPGGTGRVPIMLERADGVGSMNFTLTYDPAIAEVVKVDRGGLMSGVLFQANSDVAGVIKFGFATNSGVNKNGSIAVVEFKAVGRRGSSTTLTLSDTQAEDTAGLPIRVSVDFGRLAIGVPASGDGNGDGKITELDALMALQMSIGLRPEDLVLDMNGDGRVTAADARILLKEAVSGGGRTDAGTTPPAEPKVQQRIQPASGGTLVVSGTGTALDGVSVNVPPGALPGNQEVNIQVGLVTSFDNLDIDTAVFPLLGKVSISGEIFPAGPALSLEPAGLSFDKPVEIRIPIDPWPAPAGVEASGFWVLHGTANLRGQLEWVVPAEENVSIEPASQTLTVQVDSFSVVTPIGQPGQPIPASSQPRLTQPADLAGLQRNLNEFFQRYDGYCFSGSISLGDLAAYQRVLNRVKIVIDPSIGATRFAEMSADGQTLTLNQGPSAVTPAEAEQYRTTLWHELTHGIEWENWDRWNRYIFVPSSLGSHNTDYKERNTEYMEYMLGLMDGLRDLEDEAQNPGTDQAVLDRRWSIISRRSEQGSVNVNWPVPDLDTLRQWTKFDADISAIEALYRGGECGPRLSEIFDELPTLDPTPTLTPTSTPAPTPLAQGWAAYEAGNIGLFVDVADQQTVGDRRTCTLRYGGLCSLTDQTLREKGFSQVLGPYTSESDATTAVCGQTTNFRTVLGVRWGTFQGESYAVGNLRC